MLPPYAPQPYVDFSQEEPRAKMLAALKKVEGDLGKTYPLWIDGEAVTTGQTFESISPANPDRVVGTMATAKCQRQLGHRFSCEVDGN